MIGYMIAFPVFIFYWLRRNTPRLGEEDFMARFESIYLNVDPKVKNAILTVSLFVFRRMVYSANIILCGGSTVLQLFFQFFCCLLMLLFFTSVKPLNERFLNNIEIFNELSLITCSYFLFTFTDFVNAQTRFMMGWVFIGVTCTNILVNWLALLYKVAVAVRQVIRKLIFNWRVKRALAQKEASLT